MEGGLRHPRRTTEGVVVRRPRPPMVTVSSESARQPSCRTPDGEPGALQGQPEDEGRPLPPTVAARLQPALIHPEPAVRPAKRVRP